VCKALHGPKLFAADELQSFTEPGRGGIPRSFRRLMQEGRRHEVDALLISQSLEEVNDRVRKQLSHVITFRHEDDGALKWLERAGFSREQVTALAYPGGWICRARFTGEVSSNARAPKKAQHQRPKVAAV
jgi:hypothetical protein